jgi:hypothetical protein
MTNVSFRYEDFEETRSPLMVLIQSIFTSEEKQSLLSFKRGISQLPK